MEVRRHGFVFFLRVVVKEVYRTFNDRPLGEVTVKASFFSGLLFDYQSLGYVDRSGGCAFGFGVEDGAVRSVA